VELAGSLLALIDGLETSAESGYAESLSPFKLARSPLKEYPAAGALVSVQLSCDSAVTWRVAETTS
jgi:hypothetical protein